MKLFERLAGAINPQGIKCVICGRDTEEDKHGFCDRCLNKLPRNGHICRKCGVDIKSMSNYCDDCGKNSYAFDEARSYCRYEGAAVKLIHRFKYGGQRYLARPMAYLMKYVLDRQPWKYDAVTYVPMSAGREKERGYNQALLLAKEISALSGAPLSCYTAKKDGVPPQEDMDYAGRKENVKQAFTVTATPPKSLLVIDDVKTTGATLDEMAKALKQAGCLTVYCLTFASAVRKANLSQL